MLISAGSVIFSHDWAVVSYLSRGCQWFVAGRGQCNLFVKSNLGLNDWQSSWSTIIWIVMIQMCFTYSFDVKNTVSLDWIYCDIEDTNTIRDTKKHLVFPHFLHSHNAYFCTEVFFTSDSFYAWLFSCSDILVSSICFSVATTRWLLSAGQWELVLKMQHPMY